MRVPKFQDKSQVTVGMTFTSDTAKTSDRFDQLRRYMDRHVFGERGFVCRYAEQCSRSALHDRWGRPRDDRSFTPGQLSHIGRHYDLAEGGRSLRTLVIAMETGGSDGKISLEKRRGQLEASAAKPYSARNPHMRGTVSALRIVAGHKPGSDPAGEWLQIGNEQVHVFDAYAMANVRLCSATVKGTTESRATRTMTENCLGHLVETVRVLEPRLCIVQGIPVAAALGNVSTELERFSPNLARVRLGGDEVLLATFSHPSAKRTEYHWGRLTTVPYLHEVVVPALRDARRLLLSGQPDRR
ncbi:MAG TPA: hypothetical protein VK988_06465 [Acidimicrobiales bacterium]|nr:hypothetical protein [Acidimicrobiales bacterium]